MTKGQLNYQQWLAHCESCHNKQICMGLERVAEVGKRAKVLDFKIPVVTVAGTNGKGSTVATLSKLLQASGLKVGTYTSPHLLDFKERIQVNDEFLSEEVYCLAFESIENARQQTPLTFFEYTTLVALKLFQQEAQLDIIILEVGLGGRLDAVNIIDPDLAIVTSIGLDHQFYLGDTLESIAIEKAGIFRSKQKAIIAKNACIKSLMEHARHLEMSVTIEGEDFDFDESTSIWKMSGMANIKIKHYLASTSVSLAMAAYTILDGHPFSLAPLKQVVKSIENRVMVGRCYPVILNKSKLIFDVGHNPQGAQWLAKQIAKQHNRARVLAVWASMADKDLGGIVQPMKDLVASWFIGQIENNPRCASLSSLQDALIENQITKINSFNSIVNAFDEAINEGMENDLIVVFGSFYTVATVMQHCVAPLKMGIQELPHYWINHLEENAIVISEH